MQSSTNNSNNTIINDDAAKSALREAFIDSCLGLARNLETLVELEMCYHHPSANDPQQAGGGVGVRWSGSDLILLGESLAGNTHLKTLSLNMGKDVGCHICLTDDGRDSRSYKQKLARLTQGVWKSKLQTLKLQGVCCNLQLLMLQAVVMSPTLQRLELRDTFIADIRRVVDVLLPAYVIPEQLRHLPASYFPKEHCRLTHLGLRSCKLEDMDLLTIAITLADNPWLECLDLETNSITNVGVMYFVSHWREDSPLKALDLTWNKIGSKGALRLLDATKRHSAMRKLLLTGNERIGHAGLQLIGQQELPHVHLEYLELHQCNALPLSAEPTRESKAAARALADGLQLNSSLLEFHVGGNHFDVDGAVRMMQVATTHPTLEALALVCDESIGLNGLCHIGRMLPQTKLKVLQLDGIYFPWPQPPTKLSRKAGQALLDGVRNSPHLTTFTYHRMDPTWMEPIQVLVDLNRICRGLISSDAMVPPVWPYILSSLDRLGKTSQMYFSLREQPWLINRTRER